MKLELDEEPAPIRECDGCGVENHVRTVKGAIPSEKEAEDLTDGQEEVLEEDTPLDTTTEEVPEEAAVIEPVVDLDNETLSEVEFLKARVRELEGAEE